MNKGKDYELSLHVDLKEEDRGRLKDTLVCNDQFEEGRKKAEGEAFCHVLQMWQEMRTKVLEESGLCKALGIPMRVKGKAVRDR